jgi:thiol-disulfide isomerase/thioredoxin
MVLFQFYLKGQTYGVNDSVKLTINNIEHYPQKTIQVPIKNKKLTILNMISTTCAPCLEHIPQLDKYQKMFDEDIQIILVFHEDQKKIDRFRGFVPQLKNTILPVITKESGLPKKFKTEVYGNCIWIDQNGIIKTQLAYDQFNDKAISEYLKHGLLTKSKVTHKIDTKKAVIDNLKLDSTNKLSASFQLFRIDTGFQTLQRGMWQFEKDNQGKICRVYCYDTDLKTIAKQILDQRYLHNSRVILNIKAKERLLPNFSNEHYNHFAFEFNNNENSKTDVLKSLKVYFSEALGVEFKDTTLNINCYVLKRFKQVNIKAKKIIDPNSISGAEHKFNNIMTSKTEDSFYTLNSLIWGMFIDAINFGNYGKKFDLFIVDESGIASEEIVDISLYLRPENINMVNKSLEKYGLKLESAVRPLPVLLVEDKK